MEQLDEVDRGGRADPAVRVLALVACAAAVVVAGGGVVSPCGRQRGLRTRGTELVARRLVRRQPGYTVAGTALLTRAGRRLLGTCFVLVGVAAIVTAVAIQYRGYVARPACRWPGLTRPTAGPCRSATACSSALVPWQLLPDRRGGRGPWWLAWSRHGCAVVRRRRPRDGPRPSSWPPLACSPPPPRPRSSRGWWRDRHSGDPLPGWLFAGTVGAWLAIVPKQLGHLRLALPGRDVVGPCCCSPRFR